MVARDLHRDARRRHPAHAERHGLSQTAEARLDALARQLPPPTEEEQKFLAAQRAARLARRLVAAVVVLLVVVLGALGTVQWLRPVPPPTIVGLHASIRLPGSAPLLSWPSTGEAALAEQGLGGVEQSATQQPVPMAGLAGVLAAYVVLKDHPLSTGSATGPAIEVTAPTVAAFDSGSAAGQAEVTVTSGETLSELDALEGLLVDSGADMAVLLADWDAGSTTAFVGRMNQTATFLGLRHTHITDPSGDAPSTVSTPSDLVRLGEVAMQIPVFSQIVSLGQVTLPLAGAAYNPNFDLGQDGIVGIMAASNSATNGCYLFAARKTVDAKTATVYGAVLGQSGPDGPDTAAVEAGDALLRSALAAVEPMPVFTAGHTVATLSAPWGDRAPVTVSQSVGVLAWPGLLIPVTIRPAVLKVPVASGSAVGHVQVGGGADATTVSLESTAALTGPSGWWRVVR